MTLSADARSILEHVARASEPVAMSDFFHTIHPPMFDNSVPEDDPEREAWRERQMSLYGAQIELHDAGLVEIVHPANGERPDLVTATEAGRAALA
ncbi:hypothetical protein ABT033_01280 [Streptomyces pharetrae]|uniref:hypothetical protein n=1 Tax=Streptomyces pharetrae TaxID=291370 RepID=UPI003345E572